MANVCTTEYVARGDRAALDAMLGRLRGCEGDGGLDGLAASLGLDPAVAARGRAYGVRDCGDALRWTVDSKWTPCGALFDAFAARCGGVRLLWLASEPGCRLYWTNDRDGAEFPWEWHVSLCDGEDGYEEWFETLDDALEFINKRMGWGCRTAEEVLDRSREDQDWVRYVNLDEVTVVG